MANLQILHSIDVIRKQYPTGEEPVLVMCSDMNYYICKYVHTSASAQKLACELIGVKMANAWQLDAPKASLVRIKSEHWPSHFIRPKIITSLLGSRFLENVIDVSPSTFDKVAQTSTVFVQLLKIALFDFWIANEDRNANNANLLYDISGSCLIPIDFGCILNTADFDSPLMQLTFTDTILWSPLFKYIIKGISQKRIKKDTAELREKYYGYIHESSLQMDSIIEDLPHEWNVSTDVIKNKLCQLFHPNWTEAVWNNFIDCLNGNI